jgi:AAA domain
MSDSFAFMAAAPGTGKTAAFIAIRDGYEAAGYHVISMVSYRRSLEEHLRCRGFGNASTVAAELRRIATGVSEWDGHTVLIVDGTDVPVKDLTAVIDKACATGAKLIMAGDHNQLASIENGGGLFEELFSRQPRSAAVVPPTEALFLLELLLAKADRKAVPGDLVEEFATHILPMYGAKRAHLWFWKQAVCTIAARNPICRWFLVGGLVRFGEWIFRQIG